MYIGRRLSSVFFNIDDDILLKSRCVVRNSKFMAKNDHGYFVTAVDMMAAYAALNMSGVHKVMRRGVALEPDRALELDLV